MAEDKAEQKDQTFYWDGNVAAMEEDETDSYYLQDDLGSPMQLVGEEGEIRETYGFDEFGLNLDNRPEKQIQPFGYTGYQIEVAGGLYFAQARRYDAGAGRFVSEDKIPGFTSVPDTLNRYNYCWNQPMDYVDLNGLSREDAREYMEEYADENDKKRNPDYPSFGSNCANFVSQCLYAGSVDMVDNEWYCSGPITPSGSYILPQYSWAFNLGFRMGIKINMKISNTGNTYYDIKSDMMMSTTWSSASEQYEYFSDPNNGYINGDVIHVTTPEELEQVSGVQVGDLIYWDWYNDSDGIVNHATIVSRVDEDGTIYYAGNTGDHLEQKASDILSQGEMYIVRLNDCVFD